jgi:uncharacterized protein with von Willebrand factor type A (vWA) domain
MTLAANVLLFGRLLRRAGIPIGPAGITEAARALTHIDIGNKAEMRAALAATMLHRHEYGPLFDQAFALFWRDPEAANAAAALAAFGPKAPEQRQDPGARRIAEAYASPRTPPPPPPAKPAEKTAAQESFSVSARERLRALDFDAMSASQIAQARREIRRLALPLDERKIRRRRPSPSGGSADLRRTIQASLRTGGEIIELARSRRQTSPPPLVVLCDISGSMARYAQILLHFVHAIASHRTRVHTFLFGTRLTNITRQLRNRDPEAAFHLVTPLVRDWSGGTRIGESLHEFNRRWGRRVLGQHAIVLLITDGLDQEGAPLLAEAMARLNRSAARLIWLNPLLRWQGYQPKSQGARAMLPYVHELRAVHNLNAISDLVAALSGTKRP